MAVGHRTAGAGLEAQCPMNGGRRALLLLLLTACGRSPTEAALRSLSERVETDNIVFHHAPGDGVNSGWQERFHGWITAQLGVGLPAKLLYFKYTSRTHIKSVTGRETNGFAEPAQLAVHSIFPMDGHEAIHVYSALVGRPSDFFNEGIAVALNNDPDSTTLSPQWNGMHVHAHVQMLRRTSRFVPVVDILETGVFREVDEWRAYGEAGSFLLFLIEKDGLPRLLDFFRTSPREASREDITADVQRLWGVPMPDLVRQWLEVVDAWQ